MTKEKREAIAAEIGLTRLPRLHHFLQVLTVFLLASFAWIFFRANTLADAWYIATNALTGLGNISQLSAETIAHLVFLDASPKVFYVGVLAVMVMELIHHMQDKWRLREVISQRPAWQRWTVYYAYVIILLFLGQFGEGQFIYFQF